MKRLLYCQDCNSFFRTTIIDREKFKLAQEKISYHPIIKEEVVKKGEVCAFVIATWGCECPNKTVITVDNDAEKRAYEKYAKDDVLEEMKQNLDKKETKK